MNPNTARRRALLLILPCLAAAAFAAAGLWQPFHPFDIPLLFVNFLCLLCIAPELARAFTEGENRWKACGFIASAAIGAIAGLLNIVGDAAGGAFRFGALSVESWLWIGLFLLSVVSLAVVLVRMLLWDQPQWEQHRLWRQNARNERKEQRRAQRIAARDRKEEVRREKQQRKLARIAAARERIAAGLALFRIKNAGKLGLFREWLEARRARRSAAEDRREQVKQAKQQRKLGRIRSGESVWADAKGWFSTHGRVLLAVVLILVTLGLFWGVLFTPQLRGLLSGFLNTVNSWVYDDKILIKVFRFVVIMVSFVGIIWLLVLFCEYIYATIGGQKSGKKPGQQLLAIILVFVIVALFLAIPLSDSLSEGLKNWIQRAYSVSEEISFFASSNENEDETQPTADENEAKPSATNDNEDETQPTADEDEAQPSATNDNEDETQPSADEDEAKPPANEDEAQPSATNDKNGNKKSQPFLLAFSRYFLFYVLLIIIIWAIVYFCIMTYQILLSMLKQNRPENKNNIGAIFSEFSTSFAILLVAFAATVAFDATDFKSAQNVWSRLFLCIVFVLIMLISVGLVKLTLEQMTAANSMLQNLIHLLFIVTMAFLAELTFGGITVAGTVLDSANITRLGPTINKAKDKFYHILDEELDSIDIGPHKWSFSKRKIWRRK